MSYGGVAGAVAVSHDREQAYKAGCIAAVKGLPRDSVHVEPKYSSHRDRWFKGYDDLVTGKVYSVWKPKTKTPLWEKVLLTLGLIGFVVIMSFIE